jgi:hypothetical protein
MEKYKLEKLSQQMSEHLNWLITTGVGIKNTTKTKIKNNTEFRWFQT